MSDDIIDNRKTLLSDKINSLLLRSKTVHIASGYFRITGWNLIKNNFNNVDKMKLIMGVHTTEETVEELERGYQIQKDRLKEKIYDDFHKELEDIEEEKRSKINELYYLIAMGKVDVRVYDKKFFHSKVYLFEPNKPEISYTSIVGSSNFTRSGLTKNIELNSVIRSKAAYEYLINWFDEIWDESENFNSALLDTSTRLKSGRKEIPRYKEFEIEDMEKKIEEEAITESTTSIEGEKESQKEIQLDPFSNIIWKAPQAIGYQKWLNNGNKGILQIATGVGKTLIGIRAIYDFILKCNKQGKKPIILVAVHSNPMIGQWMEDIELWLRKNEKTFVMIQPISGELKGNIDEQIDEIYLNLALYENLIIIGHYNTVCSKIVPFLNKLSDEYKILFIADEVHELGTSNRIQKIEIFSPESCMGLSATPERYFDKSGTDFLKDFFKGIIYKYDIIQAIKDKHLCKYDYIPLICELSEDEERKYKKLTRIYAAEQSQKPKDPIKIKEIAFRRARIVKKAKEKDQKIINLLSDIRKKLRDENRDLKHMLIYLEDKDQLDRLHRNLPLDITSDIITQNRPPDPKDRWKIIDKLRIGAIQIILAIQILDQGINVPELEHAIIVSSTGNEKQFIQRRGRILRPSKYKEKAKIYDFVIPDIKAELKRAKIFYEACDNKEFVRNIFIEHNINIKDIKIQIERETLEED